MKKEHAKRIDAFLAALTKEKLHGAVLSDRDDCFYLTGFTGSDSALVLSAKSAEESAHGGAGAGKGWIITDSRYTGEAEKTAPGFEILNWRESFAAFTGGLVKKEKLKKIGYTPHTMTAAFFDGLKSSAGAVSEWRDAGKILSAQRAVKSKEEIAAIRIAIDCAQNAFLAAKSRWKTGMTEAELKNDLEWEMKRFGAEDPSFETIVAVGANASLPHAHAGSRKIQPGKMILIDFGARVNRYCSDLTRTVWPDEIPAVWAKRYEAVLEAQAAGIARIRAGAGTDGPHSAAVEIFKKHGMENKFTHSLGHGVGLAVHEAPRLAMRLPETLASGHIVTCEPGVYFPGGGGIRTEDMVLVEKSGAAVLSSLPKQLEDAIF